MSSLWYFQLVFSSKVTLPDSFCFRNFVRLNQIGPVPGNDAEVHVRSRTHVVHDAGCDGVSHKLFGFTKLRKTAKSLLSKLQLLIRQKWVWNKETYKNDWNEWWWSNVKELKKFVSRIHRSSRICSNSTPTRGYWVSGALTRAKMSNEKKGKHKENE